MHHSIFASLASAFISLSLALDPTRLVYQFPEGTWVENIAVRPSGSLLVTLFTSPDLYLIDPSTEHPEAHLVHHFPSNLALSGITETTPDTYYVIGLNVTLATPALLSSNFIYRVHFPDPSSNRTPDISVAAFVPGAIFLNGLVTLNPTTLLASDSVLGAVWAIDITTGTSTVVIKDSLFLPTSAFFLGINGIRLFRNHTLYFANSAQDFLATIPIHPNGTAAGPVTKLASPAPGTRYDDFALDTWGDAFLSTQAGDRIAEVRPDGSQFIVAGKVNTTTIAEPTSAQFGRDGKRTLYVTTGGGLAAPIDGVEIVGGQVVAVDLATKAAKWKGARPPFNHTGPYRVGPGGRNLTA